MLATNILDTSDPKVKILCLYKHTKSQTQLINIMQMDEHIRNMLNKTCVGTEELSSKKQLFQR